MGRRKKVEEEVEEQTHKVTVWNITNGDVEKTLWEATEADIDQLREQYDEPIYDIVVEYD